MKQCSTCKQIKPRSFFRKNSRRKDGLQTCCIECRAIYNKSHYKKNIGKYKQRATLHRKKYKKALQAFKDGKRCVDCNREFPAHVLHFDHLTGSIKKGNVSRLISSGFRMAFEEIKKCELVCANCHAARTYDRLVIKF